MILNTIHAVVLDILQEDRQARNSDNYLYFKVFERMCSDRVNTHEITFENALMSAHDIGLPQFESVRRTRQKIQHTFPQLKPDKAVQEYRNKNEGTYLDYVRGK